MHAYASDDWFQWHGANIQYLRGSEYELGDDHRSLITVEYANKWKYGDFFIFGDFSYPDNGNPFYYTEQVLRFSLGKILKKDMSFGLIKDVLFATSLEKAKGQEQRWLAGPAIDWNLPGFIFFQTNLFIRDNPYLSGTTEQLTIAWKRPFMLGSTRWLTEGFADFAGAEGRTKPNQYIVPRLLLDVGDLTGIGQNKLFMGLEYSYWHNKFGVDGVTESNPQFQVKWVF
ncbi:MAG: hypothetical protein MRY32_01670 [Rickettsiales bacterium]|nr:hypothetical protein [Rickettsiales bacterium]